MKRWSILVAVATLAVVSVVGNSIALVVGLDVRGLLRANLERMDSETTLRIKEMPVATTHCSTWWCSESMTWKETCTTCEPEWTREKCLEEHQATVDAAQKACPPGEPPGPPPGGGR